MHATDSGAASEPIVFKKVVDSRMNSFIETPNSKMAEALLFLTSAALLSSRNAKPISNADMYKLNFLSKPSYLCTSGADRDEQNISLPLIASNSMYVD